jgi:hypothetical protein
MSMTLVDWLGFKDGMTPDCVFMHLLAVVVAVVLAVVVADVVFGVCDDT